ncbi:hypothetical protein, partial [Pseudomonas sp. BIOMIG1N]|uniref:hypothetical protein n=1 Tax=Pseudomonas sp. BIOMIG1N TaxID=1763882 RepID=UPI0019D3A781
SFNSMTVLHSAPATALNIHIGYPSTMNNLKCYCSTAQAKENIEMDINTQLKIFPLSRLRPDRFTLKL